jgi:homoserine O-acetyltransferase/O-succinyltransferase
MWLTRKIDYLKIVFLAICWITHLLGEEMKISLDNLEPAFPPKIHSSEFIIPQYVFRNGERLSDLKIHFYTLGIPKKNEQGEVINAVLMLHYTGASAEAMLTENFMSSLYAPGKPLDAAKYFIIIPDSIGHGQSSKPSDSLLMRFPSYGYLDMVDLQYKLITEKLGLKHLKMILGTSMGGMHTWLWSELYPTFMDGAMPIVCQPTAVTGRNLLWRQMVVQAIKNDPKWQNGTYTGSVQGFLSAWPFARMLLDGVPRLHKQITTPKQALEFINEASKEASKKEAIDIVYVLEASADYDPEPNLNIIQTKLFALDFTDDQLDPIELNILKSLVMRIRNGRTVIQEGNDASYGHLTMTHPELWKHQVEAFISWIEEE